MSQAHHPRHRLFVSASRAASAAVVAITLSLLLSACATAVELKAPVLLLGEVHDNAEQHRQRLAAFQALLQSGARPVLAMEQLDRDRQAAIDASRAGAATPTADAVIAAGAPGGGQGGSGWNWDFYRPFITEALQAGLPIIAANVSREEARRVMREGLSAMGFKPDIPADVMAAHQADIVASHCGMVDGAMASRMALAQVARDQFMAQVLEAHSQRGVVLLAGNGHVRTDVGAPRWLAPEVRAKSQAVGWLEAGDEGRRAAFDVVRVTPAQARPDPCEGMRKQLPARPAAGATR